jgi:hypothetical protein
MLLYFVVGLYHFVNNFAYYYGTDIPCVALLLNCFVLLKCIVKRSVIKSVVKCCEVL